MQNRAIEAPKSGESRIDVEGVCVPRQAVQSSLKRNQLQFLIPAGIPK